MTSPAMPQGQTPPPPMSTGPAFIATAGAMNPRIAVAMKAAADMQAKQAPAGPNPAQMRQMAVARRSGAGMGPNRAKGGPVKAKSKPKAKAYAKGGSVSSASKRADGCASKGKTKGKFV